ncbi:protein translocase subunit [Podochytrium sp. JEL0797]|nr:protein translocase subunit [Podochytrium sp. JEL0797]
MFLRPLRTFALAPRPTTHHLQQRFNSGGNNVNFVSEFVKSIQRQVAEHPTFNENVKQLSDKSTEINESDAMKAAKGAAVAGGKGAQAVAETVSAAATLVGQGVGAVVNSAPAQAVGKATVVVGKTIAKAAEPILDTQAAKAVGRGAKSIQNDLSSNAPNAQYIEYTAPEHRDALRQQLLARKTVKPVALNPDAGSAVVMAQETASQKKWREFYESNPLAQNMTRMSKAIEESENPTVESVRDTWYRVKSWFDETEEAKCISAFRMVDPGFRKEEFLAEMAQFVIPEILEGNLKGNLIPIKKWCNEKVFAELSASITQQRASNLVSDCKLLDLNSVDIKKLMFLNEDKTLPVVIITFRTHEILMFRDKKTGEIKLGGEDTIDSANYAMAMTKDQCLSPEFPVDPETLGWRVITWNRSGGSF